MGYRTTKFKIKEKKNKTSSYTEFFYYFFRNILLVSIPLVIISAFILGFNMPHSSARISSSDSLAISVPSSCTLSSSVDEAHSASIINGTYRSDIGTTTLSTFCNDRNGYSVYAIGDSLNSEGNNTLVGSNGSNISSGTATSGDTSNWAMKLSLKEGDTSTTPPAIISPFDSYVTVPTAWTKVATIPSSTTDMKEGSNFTTTYATYISPTQAAGTYLGQVKYLLTHPSAATPTSAYIMQEVADWEDELSNPGDSVQAIDIRDGKQYWVTRLADGNVWMTQNLDLDLSDEIIFTSKDTDLNDKSLSGAYSSGYSYDSVEDIIIWTSAHNTVKFFGTNVSEWVNSNTAPYSASKTDDTNTGHASLGNYYNWTAAIASNDSSSIVNNTFNNISNNPKNSICPKGWRLPTISNQGTSAGSTNEFARLNYLYNNASTTDYANLLLPPIYFTKAGQVGSYALMDYPDAGSYWSSTVYSNELALNLYMSNNANIFNINANQQGHWYGNRSRTKSIRCIAR